MNGQAAPHGHGGGAMHIALGVQTENFPVQDFLTTANTEATIRTEPWPQHHRAANLTFSGNPDRRGGEWRITDQYTHRHPAWTRDAGFPAAYDRANPPYVLIFRVQDKYHVRLSTQAGLLALGPDTPRRLRSDPKGISDVSAGLLTQFGISANTLLDSFAQQQAQAIEAFDPANIEDARERVFAAILRRQGQQAFRRRLLRAYRNRCAITGTQTSWVLEAAHITPYRGAQTNALSNGLILRADIHTLFDLGLISIDPNTLTVTVSSLLAGTEYAQLEGNRLARPARRSARPSNAALQEHFNTFRR